MGKNINLTVQSPCNEEWSQMQPGERGRFCNACSKTVTDFTGMTDRQLAEFFKRPGKNICGRFYADQLERDIPVLKKRIPWLRYFFQFSLPAFILVLKSCGQKNEITGKVVTATEQKGNAESFTTVGFVKPEIHSEEISDGAKVNIEIQEKETLDLRFPDVDEMKTEEARSTGKGIAADTMRNEDSVVIAAPMENIVIKTVACFYKRQVVMGGISSGISVINNIEKDESELKIPSAPKIFPNPASAGALITISFSNENLVPDRLQLFSSSGQLMHQVELNPSRESSVFNLHLPSSLKAGMYFLRLSNTQNNHVSTEKIIIQ